MDNYFPIAGEINNSVTFFRFFLHNVQQYSDEIIDDHIFLPTFNGLREALERLFKIVILLQYKKEHCAFPTKAQYKSEGLKTHNISFLWNKLRNKCLPCDIPTGQEIVTDDLEYLDKDEVFNIVLSICDYIANSNTGRYGNINILIGSSKNTRTLSEIGDDLYDAIMRENDVDYKNKQEEEIRITYERNSRLIEMGQNVREQPPQPYQDKMKEWFKIGITIRIEKLLRALALYLRWNFEDGPLYLSTSIWDFNMMDSELGKREY